MPSDSDFERLSQHLCGKQRRGLEDTQECGGRSRCHGGWARACGDGDVGQTPRIQKTELRRVTAGLY